MHCRVQGGREGLRAGAASLYIDAPALASPSRARARWSRRDERLIYSGSTGVNDTHTDIKDVTIIGGGPTGLFAAFYAGLRGVSCRVVDALPELGGQLMALYPEKYIYDVGGLPKILAKDLVKNMIEQGTQFGPEVVLGAEVQQLVREDEHLRLVTPRGDLLTRTVC